LCSLLQCPEHVTLAGIDGLYFFRNSLVAVQNGLRPARVARFFLSDSAPRRVTGVRILESDNPLFALPTTGVFADGEFYYIADSQLNAATPGLGVLAPDRLRDIVILKTPILDESAHAPCRRIASSSSKLSSKCSVKKTCAPD